MIHGKFAVWLRLISQLRVILRSKFTVLALHIVDSAVFINYSKLRRGQGSRYSVAMVYTLGMVYVAYTYSQSRIPYAS